MMLAAIRVGDQMLEAVLDPFHRPAQLERDPRDCHGLAVKMGLEPETAADIGADHAHLVDIEAEELGDSPLHRMGQLMRHPDHQLVKSAVVVGAAAPSLHGERRLARQPKLTGDGVCSGVFCRLDISVLKRSFAENIVAPGFVNDGDTGLARLIEVVNRGQLLAVDLDRIGDIFGFGPRGRDRDGNLFANVTYLVLGEDRKIGWLEPGERRRRANRLDVAEIGGREDLTFDTLRHSYAAKAAVGHLAAPERRVPHSGNLDVRYELTAAMQKAVVFLAGDARPYAAFTHPGQTRPESPPGASIPSFDPC